MSGDESAPNIDCCPVYMEIPHHTSANLREEQLKDPELAKILQHLGNGTMEEAQGWSDRGYLISSGVLYRHNPDSDSEEPQLVVPQPSRIKILEDHHDKAIAGHNGINGTYQRISARYYWPGMYRDIHAYVQKCVTCQRYKAKNLKPAGLLQTPILKQRFQTYSIDLFGPLPESEKGHKWVFIVEDVATRWVELFPLASATASECATTLMNEVFLRYGIPRQLITDNGTQFISAIMQQLTYCLDIKLSFTPVYHPSANPVERKNRDLKVQLASAIGPAPHNTWPEKLPAIRFALNTARNETTSYTAAYLTLGSDPRTPDDVTNDFKSVVLAETFISEITPKLLQLDEVMKKVRENHEIAQDRRKERTDQHRRPDPQYAPGSLVLVDRHVLSKKSQGVSAKFAPRRDGPYRILSQVGANTYEIADPSTPAEPLGKYHTSALHPYQGPTADVPSPVAPIRRRGRPRKTPQDH